MDDKYNSVLIENKTSDADITLFIYCSWDLVCWLSYSSKIIKPGDKYLYRHEDSFKFELRAHGEKRKREVIFPAAMWEKDALFQVTGSVDDVHIDTKELSDYPHEKQICLRRQNMEKEISADCGRNLYEVLKLDMKGVRKEKDIEKQNEMIRKAYHRELLRWHPDKNPECGDLTICHEIIYAYGVLRDPESRARYNNEADFNNGWTSKSKWKSIFWSECNTVKQKREFRNRIGQLALAALLGLGGFGLTFITGGIGSVALTILAGAIMVGGIQGGLRTLKRESIKEGCSWKKYGASVIIGAVGGALVGGVAVGAAALVAGIGQGALIASETTMAQYIAMGSLAGAGGGAISSVTNDVDRKLVSKEDVTCKEVLGHAFAGLVISGTAGIVGGVVMKGIAGKASAAAAENLEEGAVEQVAILSGTKKVVRKMARSLSSGLPKVAEKATGGTLGIVETVAEERLDMSLENKPIGGHVEDRAISIECGKRLGSNAGKKINSTNTSKSMNTNKSVEPKYEPNFDGFESIAFLGVTDCSVDEGNPGRVRLISKGLWRSKMIIQYVINENEQEEEVVGNSGSITIPEDARNIEVRFQVQRFILTWCEVKKYDRINKSWCNPTIAHIFKYDRPVIRTFTIGGPLYYEAVIDVRDECWNDIIEM